MILRIFVGLFVFFTASIKISVIVKFVSLGRKWRPTERTFLSKKNLIGDFLNAFQIDKVLHFS